jgi:hypothetical protein
MKLPCKGAAKALLFVIMLAAAFPFSAGCGADSARAGEGFTDWQSVEFSEETLNREDAERAMDSELLTEEEKREALLKEYERRLVSAREEEARLVTKLADIRGIEALPELSEDLRRDYTAMAAETEKEIETLRDEIELLEENSR